MWYSFVFLLLFLLSLENVKTPLEEYHLLGDKTMSRGSYNVHESGKEEEERKKIRMEI